MEINNKGTLVELDIHGMTADDAKRQIQKFLSNADENVQEVVIIHGYRGGQVLKDMVRTELRHSRIKSTLLSLNNGQTRLILRKEY